MRENAKKTLVNDPWLSGLSPHARDDFIKAARVVHFDAGAEVFAEGDVPRAYYGVLAGEVRFSRFTQDGRQSTLAILGAPRWFGELSFLVDGPRLHTASAVGDLSLAVVAKADMTRLLKTHQSLYHGLVEQLARHTRLLYDAVDDMMLMSREGLMAKRLVELAEGGTSVRINQEELARLVGLSRQSVNRTLRLWEKAGLITRGYGRIGLADPEGLLARMHRED